MTHASTVQALALELFEALQGYLDLSDQDGLMLELAALLHDVGRFISDRDHHKHSMYIVNWTEIVGLSERDRKLVGLVARYHRKGRPRPDHVEFGSLAPEDRMRVSKLAALLRLADAMDRSHRQVVRHVVVEIGETEVDLAADATADLTVESEAVRRKGNLFTDLTGLTVRFRRVLS
jgi:exopolyphosphatase/guanosine-5'-triphosphate,3'-diphosphate pyrophosphatase